MDAEHKRHIRRLVVLRRHAKRASADLLAFADLADSKGEARAFVSDSKAHSRDADSLAYAIKLLEAMEAESP